MKKILLSVILMTATSAMAVTSDADWIVEANTLIVKGQAAGDLYLSLNAPEKLDPLSTNYDEYRTKKNRFAECSVSFYRQTTADGDDEWVMQSNAVCKIKALKGATINQ